MEAIGVASSIAGLVSLTDLIVLKISRFYSLAKGAQNEIKELLLEIQSLYGVLNSLWLLARCLEQNHDGSGNDPSSAPRMEHFQTCRKNLDFLTKSLSKFDLDQSQTLAATKVKLQWPFKAHEIRDLVVRIARNKSDLSDALTADGLAALMKALSSQPTLSDTVKDLQLRLQRMAEEQAENEQDEEKRKIFDWCSTTNPYEKHRNAKSLRHPNTVLWFFDTPEFKKWTDEPGSAIWLYGIPGAGKTILTSAAIEEAKILSAKSPRHAVAYFYCEYRLPETQRLSKILGSLIRQICACSTEAYLDLEQFYTKCNDRGKHPILPTCSQLEDLLKQLSQHFECLTIIIDGIDECSEHLDRLDILRMLSTLTSAKDGTIKTIYTSRDEIDIRRHFEAFDSISIAARGNDLELYVAASIETRMKNKTLRLRDAALKEIIINTIVSKANGMFQWATCQLDHLCLLHTDKERRRALEMLPKDLFETYKRILMRVVDSTASNKHMVKWTLLWILYAKQPLHVETIAKIVAIEVDTNHLDPDDIPDEDGILKWCSSLIRKDKKTGILSFSHFTVEEFLTCANLLKDPDVAEFSVGDESRELRTYMAKICLTYLNFSQFSQWDLTVDWEETEKDVDKDPFLEYAAMWWPEHLEHNLEDSCFELLCRLFSPRKSNNFVLWLQIHWPDRASKNVPKGASTLHIAARLGLVGVCRWLLEEKVNVNSEDPTVGTPLLCAIQGLNQERDRFRTTVSPLLTLLLEHGARGDLYLLETLSTSDIPATKNKRKITPMSATLEIAIWNRVLSYTIFKELLDRHAVSNFSESKFWEYPAQLYAKDAPNHPAIPWKEIVAEEIMKMVTMFKDILTHHFAGSLDPDSMAKVLSYINAHTTTSIDNDIDTGYSKLYARTPRKITSETAIAIAESGQTQVLETFMASGADPSVLSPCLPIVARLGNIDTLVALLRYCFPGDVNASRHVQLSWIEATLSGQIECLRTILNSGFAVNAVVTQDTTDVEPRAASALTFAVHYGVLNSFQFLSDVEGIDFKITVQNRNLLHFAVQAPVHRKELVGLLLENEVDAFQCTQTGKSVLHSLLGNSLPVEEQDLIIIKIMVDRGVSLEQVDQKGNTLLHTLLERPSLHNVRYLEELIDLIDPQRQQKTSVRNDGALPIQLAVRGRAPSPIIRTLLPEDVSLLNRTASGFPSVLHGVVSPALPDDPPSLLIYPEGVVPRKRRPANPPPLPMLDGGESFDDVHIPRILGLLLEHAGMDLNVRDERGNTPLILLATYCGEIASHWKALALKLLLENGADVNASNIRGLTTMHYLAISGYEAGLEEVLAFHPDSTLLDDEGCSPLHEAIRRSQSTTIKFWIERAKANNEASKEFRNTFDQRTSRGLLPLHVTLQHSNHRTLVLLQDMDMLGDVNVRTQTDASTALHLAAKKNKFAGMQLLIRKGADLDAVDTSLRTPLHYAAKANSVDAAKLLVEYGARTDVEDRKGNLPWMIVPASNQDLKVALQVAAQRAPSLKAHSCVETETPKEVNEQQGYSDILAQLFRAAWEKNVPQDLSFLEMAEGDYWYVCQHLLTTGQDPDQTLNEEKETALHIASEAGYLALADVLLDFGASLAVRDENGCQPLHLAAANGMISMVERLLACGAPLFSRNSKMQTSLHVAAEGGHLNIVELLVDTVGACSEDAAQHIARGNETSERMSQAGPEPGTISKLMNMKDEDRMTALMVALDNCEVEVAKYLISKGADVNGCTHWDHNVLWEASNCGDKELIEMLLSRGLNPNSGSFRGFNCLHQAASTEDKSEETVTEIATSLINAGARMDSNNPSKHSPLHCAREDGNVTLVNELLRRLPAEEVNVESFVGGTPLYHAAFRGHTEVVRILLESGADINLGWKGESPLQASRGQEHVEVIKLLEENKDAPTITPTSSVHGTEIF